MTAPLRLLVLSLALLGTALLPACGPGASPRRDLVVVLADSSEGAGAGYRQLAADGLVLHGGLRRDDDAAPVPTARETRVELYTSRRDGKYLSEVYELLPQLPSAAARSGRRLFGFSTPTGLVEDAGFDAAFEPPSAHGARGLERLPAAEIAPAARAAFDAMAADYAEQDLRRASTFLLVDLADAAPADLEALLAAFAPELEQAFLLLYFTEPDSPDRLLVHGPELPRGERNRAVDPRDLFHTAALLGRIPLPGPIQGLDVLR